MRPRRSCQPIVDQDKDAAADNDRHNNECHYARRKLISLKMIRHLESPPKEIVVYFESGDGLIRLRLKGESHADIYANIWSGRLRFHSRLGQPTDGLPAN
jgi:hypothetical protein